MTIVLLAEDEQDLYTRYVVELERAGFNVYHATDSPGIIKIADDYNIDIIVSDTKLDNRTCGYEACKSLLDGGKINNALIVAMSMVRDNDKYWVGIAHEFYYKEGIYDLGKTVRAAYQRYLAGQMPKRYKVF